MYWRGAISQAITLNQNRKRPAAFGVSSRSKRGAKHAARSDKDPHFMFCCGVRSNSALHPGETLACEIGYYTYIALRS
jgi:hypothetical protein